MLKKDIAKIVKCPIDRSELSQNEQGFHCQKCKRSFPYKEVVKGKFIPDFRIENFRNEYRIDFKIPPKTYTENDLNNFGEASFAKNVFPSREELRKLYKTKLQKEVLYYIEKLGNELGRDIIVLDLGSGGGGNKRYLYANGFTQIVSLEYADSGKVKLLGDVHRLPFANDTFDLIITTSTIEHFYNPYIAFIEMSRTLKKGGHLIGSGSLWESWHDGSNFHFTPGGWFQLAQASDLKIKDMWSGWGFIPSVSSHALGLFKHKKFFYRIQKIYDTYQSKKRGTKEAFIKKLKTSGSIGIFAQKM